MVKVGEKVLFTDGTSGRVSEAEVTAIAEDGSLRLLYPHPTAPDVMADCEGVQRGNGAWQWHRLTAEAKRAAKHAPVKPADKAPPPGPVEKEERPEEADADMSVRTTITSRRSTGEAVEVP